MLRPLVLADFAAWREVRHRCADWLLKWEPQRLPHQPDTTQDRDAFAVRCSARQRERQLGTGYGFGIFVDGTFCGEINLSSIQRGPFQNAYVGYWIDQKWAGQGIMPEAVVVLARFAFEELHLHRHPGLDHPPQRAEPPRGREARPAQRGHGPALPRDQRRLGGPRALRHHRRGVGGRRDELAAAWL
jgi:hypothetical protein